MEYDIGYKHFLHIIKQAGKFLIPLYKMDESRKFPAFIGSSVYCSIGPIKFLFSAEHVFRDIYPSKILYPYSMNKFSELPCDGVHTHSIAALDIGIIQLNNDLPMWDPLSAVFFSKFQTGSEFQHLLVGYPASYTKRSNRERQKIKLEGYLTNATTESAYDRLKINITEKMILEFKKEGVSSENHVKLTFPNPNGMSGGAVFQFHEETPDRLFLIGIMSEWDTRKKNAIIATRIEKYTEMFTVERLT